MSQGVRPYETTENNYKTADEVSREYMYWRHRLTYGLIVGYASFYLVRQNFSMAKTSPKFPFSAEAVGWGFSVFSIIYGIFKFVSGAICDRSNARYFMPVGLACAALVSLIAGCCHSAFWFGLMLAISACFQSMGWPSVSRTLTQWFGPRELGMRWGIVNASHQIGSICILLGGAWLLECYSWRYLFIVPSIICFAVAIWLWDRLRDTPESLGLPSVEVYEGLQVEEDIPLSDVHESFFTVFKEHILFNYRLWIVCVANFFVYFVRMGYFCWGPTIIAQTQQSGVMVAGCKVAILEAGGLLGGLFVGWFTDKYMPSRRGVCGAYMMILLGVVIGIYWILTSVVQDPLWNAWMASPVVDTMFWAVTGFLIYGPQTLGGLSGAEFGSKKAAAAAAGLTGTVGYLAGGCVGIGVPTIAKYWGWNAAYISFVVTSILGGIFFALTLKKR
ncbi:MAG: MFS transporter [Puniceicoccales bacterium]|jgi:sugar phosphate permease|nr:MFS transporter [Puniceicoccales bacterium]